MMMMMMMTMMMMMMILLVADDVNHDEDGDHDEDGHGNDDASSPAVLRLPAGGHSEPRVTDCLVLRQYLRQSKLAQWACLILRGSCPAPQSPWPLGRWRP